MMKKRIVMAAFATALTLSMSVPTFAGQWQQNTMGWWYQNDNGSYPKNQWQEINGKQYYFDSNGYMLSNTTTPDGYRVGADGAWIQENTNAGNSLTPPQNYIDILFTELNTTWTVDTTDTNYRKNGFSYSNVGIILNNSVIKNQWIHWRYKDGTERWEYRDGDGHALWNGITPDGYQVTEGEWRKPVIPSALSYDGVHTKRASDTGMKVDFTIGSVEQHERIKNESLEYILLDKGEFTFKIESALNTIDPTGHEIWVVGYVYYNGIPFAIGEPKVYTFEYDKEYTLDYTGKYATADSFYDYCKREDLLIQISVVDSGAFGVAEYNALSLYMKYK